MKKKTYFKLNKGFTLIEMIVSLAIFTVVALIAVGALLKILDLNRKSINLKNAIENINFALESMSREMRVGSKYYYVDKIPGNLKEDDLSNSGDSKDIVTSKENGGGWVIAFLSSKLNDSKECNLIYAYRLYEGKLQKAQADPNSNCSNSKIQDVDFADILSPNINLTNTVISVNNSSQPKVKIFLKGYSMVKNKDRVEFSLQTTISQRIK